MKVSAEEDPGSATALMAVRGGRAAGRWILGGIQLGGPGLLGGLVFVGSVYTAPFALIAGAIDGAAEAATHARRHEAAGRLVERELREEALGARLAHSVVNTLAGAAYAPVRHVYGNDFTAGSLLAHCGAIATLEIEFERIEFEARSVIEFVARPHFAARYRWSEAGHGALVQGETRFAGRYHKFVALEEDGTGALRVDFGAAVDALSRRILAALPSNGAWTLPADAKVAAKPSEVSTRAENLREPLRVHPDLVRPPHGVRLAAVPARNRLD